MNYSDVPIIDALANYNREKVVRFHMPGHKGNEMAKGQLAELIGSKAYSIDVTNIPEMDNLHQPHGIIKQAEQLAAEAFGADKSYFLVNGSSSGLQALIMTVCNPGDKIIVPRNIHRSVLGGIILTGAIPVYYKPAYDMEYCIPLGCISDEIEQCLKTHGSAKGVLVVNPTYHGVTSDIVKLSDLAHRYGMPLIVDEAHGPHLKFHKDLPQSAIEQGADAVVHGTHKMLTSFTQASMLHLRGNLLDRNRLEAVLRILQSTSTSYLLLASLDSARAMIQENGVEMITQALENSAYLRTEIANIRGLKTMGKEIIGRDGVHGLDLTKVTVSFRELGISGYCIEKVLREEFKIQVEMADLFNILLLVTYGNRNSDTIAILKALTTIIDSLRLCDGLSVPKNDVLMYPENPEMVLTPREAFFAKVEFSPLDKVAGKISAEIITCYPPGVPVIGPGEKYTQDIIDYIIMLRSMGASFQGCQDHTLETVLTVR
ncbi:aminotransferase class I/II-fold pyridoxal phosphate-dependent enzyme [Dendrosporobacter sp. 1207_IL3150]|uniref:aminotransferase class I/II-fold pyridoxal phosphate-dependent enzyme n=1 Tax=Dendrosporobacter sp. 1207_IL3150 TaxID=3084054 RepID=UPI002FDB906A